MNKTHIISTTDPINGFDIVDPSTRPHVVDGDAAGDLTVYFESETSRQAYLDLPVEHPEQGLSKTSSNPTADYSN
jgi:hypothetical protein